MITKCDRVIVLIITLSFYNYVNNYSAI